MFWKELQAGFGTRLKFSTASHPQTNGQSEQTIQTLKDMLRVCTLDFPGSWAEKVPLMKFAYNNSYHQSLGMSPFEVLYKRKYRSLIHWHKAEERRFLGPEKVDAISKEIEVIKRRLQASMDRQKKYTQNRRRPLEFEVGDQVFLKVSPMRGVIRFGKKGKLSPRYVGPFEIVEHIDEVAYQLALLPALSRLHDVFHVSMLKKYLHDPSHVLSYESLDVDPKLTYEERPVKILDRKDKVLRNNIMSLVRVLWRNHVVEEATWETEEDMRKKYPELF